MSATGFDNEAQHRPIRVNNATRRTPAPTRGWARVNLWGITSANFEKSKRSNSAMVTSSVNSARPASTFRCPSAAPTKLTSPATMVARSAPERTHRRTRRNWRTGSTAWPYSMRRWLIWSSRFPTALVQRRAAARPRMIDAKPHHGHSKVNLRDTMAISPPPAAPIPHVPY